MLLLSLLLLLAPVYASPPGDDAVAERTESEAEYLRLHQELERLLERSAWTGVERTYQKLELLGERLSYEDYLAGAHSARAVGDITSMRARLIEANKLRTEREVIEWLADFDEHHAFVDLQGDRGRVSLERGALPFDPHQVAAIQFAMEVVDETGTFQGYLPEGPYTFGGIEMNVMPQVMASTIDLRTEEGMERERKRKRKRNKER